MSTEPTSDMMGVASKDAAKAKFLQLGLRNWDAFWIGWCESAAHQTYLTRLRALPREQAVGEMPVPEFSCDDDGALTVEWYRSSTAVLSVACDDGAELHFAAATGPGITSSGCWQLGEQPPQSFYDAYRAIAALSQSSEPLSKSVQKRIAVQLGDEPRDVLAFIANNCELPEWLYTKALAVCELPVALDTSRERGEVRIAELEAELKLYDPDPVVCGCHEAGCPHTRIAKLPRQALVDHFHARIKDLQAELDRAPAAAPVAEEMERDARRWRYMKSLCAGLKGTLRVGHIVGNKDTLIMAVVAEHADDFIDRAIAAAGGA